MIIFPMKIALLVLLSICLATVSGQSAADDLVQNFIPSLTSNWYSGYLNLSETKNIHYVFFESQKDRNDPLIVYIGNGPGCSSLFSMGYENGPFTFDDQLNLKYNEYSWNQHANVLYLETPAGVGFSTGSPNSTDKDVTTDNLLAITYFLTRFPTYLKNDLYIAGTGYAGITAPYLAIRILQHNQNPIFHSKLNIKGLLLGNPCTTAQECYASGAEKNSYYHYQFLYNHGFLSDNSFNNFKSLCAIDYNTAFCFAERQRIDAYFKKLSTSVYNIYAKCYRQSNETVSFVNGVDELCEDTAGLLKLLNDESTQDALHVNKGRFNVCSEEVFDDYIGDSTGSYSLYPKLISSNLKLFIYSGDLDSSVPIIGTKNWVAKLREQLDIPVKKVWREWWTEGVHQNEDQVAGMVWELNTLTLATVRGTGFVVGRDRPKQLYTILDAFLNNKRLPVRK